MSSESEGGDRIVRKSSRPTGPPERFGTIPPQARSISVPVSQPSGLSRNPVSVLAPQIPQPYNPSLTVPATPTVLTVSVAPTSVVPVALALLPVHVPFAKSVMSSPSRLPLYQPRVDDPSKFIKTVKVMCGISTPAKDVLDMVLRSCFSPEVISSCIEAKLTFNADLTLDELAKTLKLLYGPVEVPKELLKKKFLATGQNQGEDVRAFHLRLSSLGSMAEMSADELKLQFMKGISVRWRQVLKLVPNFEDMTAAGLAAKVASWEEEDAQSLAFDAPKSSSGANVGPPVVAAFQPSGQKNPKGSKKKPQGKSQHAAASKSPFGAPKAQQTGASAVTSSAPTGNDRCWLCGDKSHYISFHKGKPEYDHWVKAKDLARQSKLGMIGVSIVLRGDLDGAPSNLVLDTGSDRSYVRVSSLSPAQQQRIKPASRSSPITADNVTVLALEGEVSLMLRIADVTRECLFFVSKNLVHPMILGLDIMGNFGLTINTKSLSVTGVGGSVLLALSSNREVHNSPDGAREFQFRREPVLPEGTVKEVVRKDCLCFDENDSSALISHTREVLDVLNSSISVNEVRSSFCVSEVKELETLVRANATIFSSSLNQMRVANVPRMKLQVAEGVSVVRTPRFFHPPEDAKIGQNFIDEFALLGIIEPSTSICRSQWFIVKDQIDEDGKVKPRFVMDSIALNRVTIVPSYPLPRMDDLRARATGAKYWFKFDIKRAFLSIQLEPSSRHWTAFEDTKGQVWQWVGMAFGLEGSPTYFQMIMDTILATIPNVWCYIDDIVVWGNTVPACLSTLSAVFEALKRANLLLASPKCRLGMAKVKMLGNLFSASGISVDPERLQTLYSVVSPKTREELRSFFGAAEFIAGHVPQFGLMRTFLQPLLSTKNDFAWSKQREEAFQALKKMLMNAKVLSFPDPAKELILETDASALGYAAILYQGEGSAKELIAVISRPLKDVETRYSSQENEAGAVNWAVKKLNQFILGHRRLTIITDHESLQWMFNDNQRNPKVLRWRTDLNVTCATVRYRPGPLNVVADFFSRYSLSKELSALLPGSDPQSVLAPMVPVFPWRNEKTLISLQGNDPFCQEILQTIEDVEKNSALARKYLVHEFFQSVEGLLMTFSKAGKKTKPVIVAPATIRSDVCSAMHGLGHFAVDRTVARVREQFYWPALRQDVIDCLAQCVSCAQRNMPSHANLPTGELRSNHFNDLVAFDIQGPIPQTNSYATHILVGVDVFTKFMMAVPLTATSSRDVINAINAHWIAKFGPFKRYLSDNGSNFASAETHAFIRGLGATVLHSTPYHPQGNGVAERMMRTIQDTIAKEDATTHTEWDLLLPSITYSINTAVSTTTGFSPYFAVFARNPNGLVNVTPSTINSPQVDLMLTSQQLSATEADMTALAQKKSSDLLLRNQDCLPFSPFQEGDTVLAKSQDVPQGQVKKFKRMYTRRFLVMGLRFPNSAICRAEDGSTHKFHLMKLKKAPDSMKLPPLPEPSANQQPATPIPVATRSSARMRKSVLRNPKEGYSQ